MIVKVNMLAFHDHTIREVTVPDCEVALHLRGEDPRWIENHLLEKVFYYGQNDFATGPEKNTSCSVSVADVVEVDDAGVVRLFLVAPCSFKEISQSQFNSLKALPRRDRHFCDLVMA